MILSLCFLHGRCLMYKRYHSDGAAVRGLQISLDGCPVHPDTTHHLIGDGVISGEIIPVLTEVQVALAGVSHLSLHAPQHNMYTLVRLKLEGDLVGCLQKCDGVIGVVHNLERSEAV